MRGQIAVLVVLVATSGCLGVLTGEPLEFEATPAEVPAAVAEDAGYEPNGTRDVTVTRSFEVAGQEREVRVTNYVTEYRKTVSLPATVAGPGGEDLAAFVVLSSPEVSLAGRTFNPLADASNRELLERIGSRYGAVGDARRVGEQTVRFLGSETTAGTFETTMDRGGVEAEVRIRVAKTTHGGDVVAAIGVYPSGLPGEGETVRRLIRNVEHGG